MSDPMCHCHFYISHSEMKYSISPKSNLNTPGDMEADLNKPWFSRFAWCCHVAANCGFCDRSACFLQITLIAGCMLLTILSQFFKAVTCDTDGSSTAQNKRKRPYVCVLLTFRYSEALLGCSNTFLFSLL